MKKLIFLSLLFCLPLFGGDVGGNARKFDEALLQSYFQKYGYELSALTSEEYAVELELISRRYTKVAVGLFDGLTNPQSQGWQDSLGYAISFSSENRTWFDSNRDTPSRDEFNVAMTEHLAFLAGIKDPRTVHDLKALFFKKR